MHTTRLRKVGDSIVLTVPPAVLEQLQLQANAKVGLTVDGGHLHVQPIARPRYTMTQLLAESDYTQAQAPQEREWVDAPAAGGELV